MAEPSNTNPLEYIHKFVIGGEAEGSGSSGKLSPVRVNPVLSHPMERRIKLSGEWGFRLDPDDAGVGQRWYADINVFNETIAVPGCWQGQGFGGDGEDEVADFRLRAQVFRATYRGTGWYARSFQVPIEWNGRRIWLNFGGVHPSAEVWLNGVKIGGNILPFLPFGFEVTHLVCFDKLNNLVVRVHEQNRMLGFTYNFQGNWSGIYRDVELVATGESFIEQFRIYPEADQQRLRCLVDVADIENCDGELYLEVSASPLEDPTQISSLRVSITGRKTEFSIPVQHPLMWSPDHPALYRVDAALGIYAAIRDDGRSQDAGHQIDAGHQGNAEHLFDAQLLDALSEWVGFVKLSTSGKHFLINDEPYYMRGTGDFLSCPETGCPDTDRERWRKKLSALRAYGYNYVRCQSFVYPPEYFDIADEVGLIVQSEMGMLGAWGGYSAYHVYQWPQPTIDNYEPIKTQWDGIVLRDVNHPSANIYCMSNEYNTMNFPSIAWQCYRDTRKIKPSCFVIWTDGGYREDLPSDFVNDEATVDEKCAKPLIQHEFRWWSSYPDVRIKDKYSGAVRPYAIEIAVKTALHRKLNHILPRAAENSQRLQLLEAKFNMELFRRLYPNLAGICHFNAMDTNPSPQGILDEFFEQKVASSSEWLQTNGDTVVLSDLGCDNVIFTGGDRMRCGFWVSDFSHPPLQTPVLSWKLISEEGVLCQGQLEYSHTPYRTCPIGEIEIQIPDYPHPRRVKLDVKLVDGSRSFTNCWNLWVFPRSVPMMLSAGVYRQPAHTWLREVKAPNLAGVEPETLMGYAGVLLTEAIDEAVVDFMRAGGRVILAASEGLVRPTTPSWPATWNTARYFFTPPANYPTYEDKMSGTIIQRHLALGDLPHEGFADLLFFRMIGNSAPVDIGALGLVEGDPIIRCIHQYAVGRSLAYLVECAFGKGGLILCSMDLRQSLPEARYLFDQLCKYAAGDRFKPEARMTEETLRRLLLAGKITA